jgi:uncharacterized protein
MSHRPVVEGFAIETTEGLILTVKGFLHPPGRTIAYLRYLPDPAGDRQRADRTYRRVYHFSEQRAILEAKHPDLLDHDPVLGTEVQSVPHRRIAVVYDPVEFQCSRRENGPSEPVETDALALLTLIQETAGVPWSSLGISGSIMLGTQRPESDIDLVVYGETASRKVHRALGDLVARPGEALRRPDEAELAVLHQAHAPDTPLSLADFVRTQRRKVNEGRFRGRSVFARFMKEPAEYGERYGDHLYRPLGTVTVQGVISDDRDAIFTPCCYGLQTPVTLEGVRAFSPDTIVSYRGRFSDQAHVGEQVEVHGTLEEVTPRVGPSHHQVVVGSAAGDYLRIMAS